MQILTRVPLEVPRRGRQSDAEGDLLLHPGDSVTLVYRHAAEKECR